MSQDGVPQMGPGKADPLVKVAKPGVLSMIPHDSPAGRREEVTSSLSSDLCSAFPNTTK